MTRDLLSHVLVPVASESDAATTADAVLPRVAAGDGRVTAVVVVEKAGGAPDKASVEGRELAAEDALALLAERGEAAGVPVETEIAYGTDVADAILAAAGDADASAVVFTPRRDGGGLLLDLLTGDVARHLVERSDRPVVVLPAADGGDDAGDDADGTSDEEGDVGEADDGGGGDG